MRFADYIEYIGGLDGPDTTEGLTDADIEHALVEDHTALGAAVVLTQLHGHLIVAHDVRQRVAVSPSLQRVQQASEQARFHRAAQRCMRVVAERAQERQRLRAEWRRLHDERVQLCELRRARNHGPRCGAKTRTGSPCKRKPELGKRRCRNHGGLSTGARTPEGRARALAALARGREQRRRATPL